VSQGFCTALKKLVACFVRETRASVLPTFTLALVPMLGMVGAAVDYSRASNIRTKLQGALDAAIIAGARDGTSNWSNVAIDVFNANVPPQGMTLQTPTLTKTDNASYAGSAAATVATTFLGVLGTSSMPVQVRSTAAVRGSRPGQFCILALNMSAPSSVKLTGNSAIDVNAPQCILQVNSNSASAVYLNGNTSISSADNCFVGAAIKVGNATLSPAPDAMCKPVPDPFANYPKPSVGPCDQVDYSASGNKTITLQPGVYCGGMKFSGQVTVTFAPGLYIIKDGVLQASGGTSFTGNGVTFYLTGLGAGVQLTGQANWHLVAPTSGPLAGFVFFLDPRGPTGFAANSSQLAGTAEMYFEGVVYLPQQHVALSGGSQTVTPSPYTGYIVDTLEINGNGTLVINNDATKTNVPIPTALQLTLGNQPYLTQ
jgi:Flp pilus assembly protein TadG